MTQLIGTCLGLVAPYYNLILVAIVIMLFINLFRTSGKKTFVLPWKILFIAILIYVVEEGLTAMRPFGISYSKLLNPLFEMIIISLFIYMLLVQKDHIIKKAR